MEDDKEIEAMLEREQHVLTIIQEHMKKSLDSRITYKYDKGKDYPGIQTELFQSFWDECIEKYQNEIERYCMDYTDYTEIQETSDDDEEDEDREDDDEYCKKHIDFYALSADICDKCVDCYDESADCYCQDLPSVPQNSEDMPELEVRGESILLESHSPHFADLDKAFFAIRNWVCLDSKSSEKCNELYLKLRIRLEKELFHMRPIPKVKFNIRENTFTYLPDILDLENQDICGLLPYLMTAYCCNCGDNRFLYEGKTLLKQTFEVGNIEPIDAPKLRERIPKFCQIFSLSQAKLDSAFNVDYDRPRRKVGLSAFYNPGFPLSPKKREVVDYIFDYWSEKIPQFASESKIDIKIDTNLCEGLFYYYVYMNDDSQKTAK